MWPPEKTLAYFDKAIEVRNMMNGVGQPTASEPEAAVDDKIMDALGFKL